MLSLLLKSRRNRGTAPTRTRSRLAPLLMATISLHVGIGLGPALAHSSPDERRGKLPDAVFWAD